jgi:hypothetical protein
MPLTLRQGLAEVRLIGPVRARDAIRPLIIQF